MINNEWKECLPSLKKGNYNGDEPWLLYHQRGSSQATLYDPRRGRHYVSVDQNLEGARVLGSNMGWLMASDSVSVNPGRQHRFFVYNPFKAMRYNLPVLNIGYPLPSCVVRCGIVTKTVTQRNFYAIVVTDNFYALHVHYIGMRNGIWDVAWTLNPIPIFDDGDDDQHADYRGVESISPSENLLSIRMSDHRKYDLNLQTREWEVSEILGEDTMDWNRLSGLSIHQMKETLNLPAATPTSLELIGTKTDRHRVRNQFMSDDASTSEIDGVWLEVRA
ncbi:uncharacterized protein LOC18026051 [Eutrema salsugineum]|nr:uncharacterized protein LOC18026051 [Eutrema salsugineum]